ncbi:hypothetical protein HMPREF9389_0267 [Streptococcus sanguinis SK355]|uniref:Uncharacterized protein n=1 Tax=Streptococcus sanguinis SK355 TaxID=888816 RepID=F3UN59_STRSA|nr:hypothetical protein HMPREF9389_0267 [Streptococcus sanguinis SK355]
MLYIENSSKNEKILLKQTRLCMTLACRAFFIRMRKDLMAILITTVNLF